MPDVAVKSLGIIFSSPMVRAILDGKKTQTRRVIKPQPPAWATYLNHIQKHDLWQWSEPDQNPPRIFRRWPEDEAGPCYIPCAYGKCGDQLWVRETWRPTPWGDGSVYYRATGVPTGVADMAWKPSLFMPRSASRITLEIIEVRVQRLKEITEEDAIAEGVDCVSQDEVRRQATWSRRQDFAGLWDRINKKRGYSWESNSWVWALTFKRLEVKSQRVEGA